ncbi:MAG: hypothetical protein AABY03_00790, partial [Nanoarchaeota archaeon]
MGKNTPVKGTATYGKTRITDSCNVLRRNYVREAFCKKVDTGGGGTYVAAAQSIRCPTGTRCSSGVCVGDDETFALSSNFPTASAIIGGTAYAVELISATDTSATIMINGDMEGRQEINEGSSKLVNGINVKVITSDET